MHGVAGPGARDSPWSSRSRPRPAVRGGGGGGGGCGRWPARSPGWPRPGRRAGRRPGARECPAGTGWEAATAGAGGGARRMRPPARRRPARPGWSRCSASMAPDLCPGIGEWPRTTRTPGRSTRPRFGGHVDPGLGQQGAGIARGGRGTRGCRASPRSGTGDAGEQPAGLAELDRVAVAGQVALDHEHLGAPVPAPRRWRPGRSAGCRSPSRRAGATRPRWCRRPPKRRSPMWMSLTVAKRHSSRPGRRRQGGEPGHDAAGARHRPATVRA